MLSAEDLVALQKDVRTVHVSDAVESYIVRLVRATRDHASLDLGASPRASLGLYRGGQALAALQGRSYVLPDDVKRLAPFIINHRVISSSTTRLRGRSTADIVRELLDSVPTPVEA